MFAIGSGSVDEFRHGVGDLPDDALVSHRGVGQVVRAGDVQNVSQARRPGDRWSLRQAQMLGSHQDRDPVGGYHV